MFNLLLYTIFNVLVRSPQRSKLYWFNILFKDGGCFGTFKQFSFIISICSTTGERFGYYEYKNIFKGIPTITKGIVFDPTIILKISMKPPEDINDENLKFTVEQYI